MNFKANMLIVALSLTGLAASAQTLKCAVDKSNMDLSVNPGTDFYKYAVGGWLKSHPLDAQHSSNGSFTDLEEQNNDRMIALINEYAGKKMEQGSTGQKIGGLYRLYMDSVSRNKQGYAPIKPILKKIAQAKKRADLIKLMYQLDAKGYNTTMFSFGLSMNPMKTDEYQFGIDQGGLGLDPEYYTNPNEQQKAAVEAYKSRMKDFFVMTGDKADAAEKKMKAVFAIEEQIARSSYDQLKLRDPQANIHFKSQEQLLKDFPGLDWNQMIAIYGFPEKLGVVNVGQPEAIKEVEKIMNSASLESLKAYMQAAVIKRAAGLLSDAFNDRNFEYRKALYGTKEQQPRWKRGVAFVDRLLGESIGKLYVTKYFPESSKKRALDLVDNLRKAFEQRIQENTWMTEATKKKAIEKLNSMRVNIGYPDKWQELEKYVEIDENKSLAENMEIISVALTKGQIEKYWGHPVDKSMMACNPQVVNAFYNPYFNSINFPAAILQAPFFDADAEDAVNYGGIGTVIGHEMSHGFDDQGCQFDKEGNLANWWTAEDKANYDKRTKVLADWFSAQEAIPGLKVNGEKTLGENIGDNGGINVALRAFLDVEKKNPSGNREGFSPAQRFFLAYGRIWASNMAKEWIAYIVNSDVHSPNEQRVNAALPMIDSWYDAFGVEKGDKLYVPSDKRAHIW